MTYNTQNPVKTLGAKIRKIREQQGISQITLSVQAGFNFNYVGMVERADTNPSFLALMNIALALDKNVSELTRGIVSNHIMVLRENPNRRGGVKRKVGKKKSDASYPKLAEGR